MTELKLPLDFERLPEFWQLANQCRLVEAELLARGGLVDRRGACATQAEGTAALIWLRLFVVLGYLARGTNRPGWLNAVGEQQLNQNFPQFTEPQSAVVILTEAGLLRREADGCYCDLFTSTNKHLAGDFLTPAERGNRRSLPSRSKNAIAQEAMQQAQLLPPEIFRRREGEPMQQRLVDRSMILITTLDRCLRANTRHKSNFTQGLMADAAAAIESTDPKALTDFYEWLAEKFDHPATPKSADQILKDWERVLAASRAES